LDINRKDILLYINDVGGLALSNQVIHWSMLIVPLLTLFFMKKEEINRYVPVAVFATVLTMIILDIGITLGIWVVRESVFPFNEIFPYYLGTMPVLAMWVFKFTNGRFWAYMTTNLILDIGFNFFLLDYFLPIRGMFSFVGISPLQGLTITLAHAVLIYGYQMWHERVFSLRVKQTNTPVKLQAAAKPLPEEESDKE